MLRVPVTIQSCPRVEYKLNSWFGLVKERRNVRKVKAEMNDTRHFLFDSSANRNPFYAHSLPLPVSAKQLQLSID